MWNFVLDSEQENDIDGKTSEILIKSVDLKLQQQGIGLQWYRIQQ